MAEEPTTVEAGQQYLNRTIEKFFPANKSSGFPGGTFSGTVTDVTDELRDADGVLFEGVYYQVEYEDGDAEHMSWTDLIECLVNQPEPPRGKRPAGQPEDGEDTNRQQRVKRSRRQHDDASDDQEGDNQGAPSNPYPQPPVPPADADGAAEEPESDGRNLVVRTRGLAGHLKSIHLQNFMCHANFQMDFGMHVNVVSGQNGSGKSAVMQGLQITLGATAKSTGRASSLHHFIKTGAHEAIVKVTLWNTGEDAYKPQVYGECITVERKILQKGGGFRLLDHAGRKVSTRREDLQALLDHLSLNASNPLTVMTQDTSRDFLSGSVAGRKKFDLFMEATMLQEIDEQLGKAELLLAELKAIFNSNAAEHKENAGKLAKLEKQLKQLKEAESMGALKEAYDVVLPWVLVEDMKREVGAHLEEVRGFKEDVDKLEAIIRKGEVTVEELRGRESMMKGELQAEQERIREATSSLADLKRAGVAAQRDLKRREGEVADVERALREAQTQQQILLENLRNSNQAEVAAQKQAEMAEYQDRLKHLTDTVQQADAHSREQTTRMWAAKEALSAKHQKSHELRQMYEHYSQQMRDLEKEVVELESTQETKAGRFGGRAVLALQQAVARDTRFAKKPIGPLGAYINLKDPNYSVAVEAAIGWCLESWICDNYRDATLLRELARRHHVTLRNLITAKFSTSMYSVPPNRLPPGNLTTILRLLTCEPEHRATIINVLIDHGKVESTVLTGPEGGRELAYNRPQNVGRIFEQSGSQWKSTRASVTFIPIQQPPRPRLGADVASQIQMTQSQLAQVREKALQVHHQVTSMNDEIAQLSSQRLEAEQAFRAAGLALSAAKTQLNTLQSSQAASQAALEQEAPDTSDDERMLEQATGEVQRLQAELANARGRLAQAQRDEEAARRVFMEAKQLARSDAGTTMQLNEQLGEIVAQIGQKAHTQQKCRRQQEELNKKIEAVQRDIDEKEAQLQESDALIKGNAELMRRWQQLDEKVEMVKDAERRKIVVLLEKQHRREGGPAPGTPEFAQRLEEYMGRAMTSEHLDKAAKRLEQTIAEVERDNGGSLEAVQGEYDDLAPEVERKARWLEDIRMMYGGLSGRVAARRQGYLQLFHTVQETVNNKFNKYMARRRHTGYMQISKDRHELNLEVRVGGMDNKKAKAVTDLKTLSGGERSYTTVAFLLALGEWTESPFRCMDEFDVFMDAINRRIATETLLEFAMEHNEMQYIFLTPQDLQAVDDAKRQLEQRKQVQLPEGFLRVVQIHPARDR